MELKYGFLILEFTVVFLGAAPSCVSDNYILKYPQAHVAMFIKNYLKVRRLEYFFGIPKLDFPKSLYFLTQYCAL